MSRFILARNVFSVLLVCGASIFLSANSGLFAEPATNPATSTTDSADAKKGGASNAATAKARAALVVAFRTNLGYCQDWLKAKDAKSLAQSVGALSILTEAINRHTADAGREKIDNLKKAVSELADAAKANDIATCEKSIAALPAVLDSITAAPISEKPATVKKTTAGFTPLMHLIDGTFSDAKTSLATGDAAEAKSYAVVLADLGQWLVADRSGDQWHKQADDLAAAAQEVASSDSTDPKILRAALHNVYTHCEACHHRQR